MAKHMRSDSWFVVDQMNVALEVTRFWIWKNVGKPLPLNETWNGKYEYVLCTSWRWTLLYLGTT